MFSASRPINPLRRSIPTGIDQPYLAAHVVADPALARHIPLGRLGRSEDLAPMALAVLSNRVSAYVTGAAIVVDGGLSLTNWFDPPELDDL